MNNYKSIKELVIGTCATEGGFPSEEKLASLVKKNFPDSAWQKTHYSWYKSQIKTGKIELPSKNTCSGYQIVNSEKEDMISTKQWDGFKFLEKAISSLKIDLTALVAATGLWANPEVHKILVRDNNTGALYPNVRRARKNKGEEPRKIVNGVTLDSNNYANAAIKRALGIKGKGKNFSTCHIWDNSCYDEFNHTTIANLVLLPSPLSTLADHHRGVKDALKYRAYELYAWHPKKENIPVKPKSYPSNWREPLPITDKIKKSIKRRRT